jgi:hypothetical protein
MLSIVLTDFGVILLGLWRVGGRPPNVTVRVWPVVPFRRSIFNVMIMERILKLRTSHGTVDVPVRIFSPVQETNSWQCHWKIQWPDRIRQNTAGGFDAVQSLILALQMVGVELYASEEHRSGRLQWITPGDGYGFPVTHNCRDLLEGDDAQSF